MRPEALRTMNYEVAEAIAPTWERRRAFVEEILAPVRRWMIDALAPSRGDTVLELAAGVGDTGFEAAGMLGAEGRLISSDISLDAGFGEVHTSEVPVSAGFADVGEYLDIVADTAGPIAIALRTIPEDERTAIRRTLEQAFAPFAHAGGCELPGAALVAAAS